MNLPSPLSADIETTVLVAVWSDPIIFQGYFKLSLHEPIQEFYIYFRCSNEEYSQEDFLNEEFFPNQFQFTHLYNQLGVIKNQIIAPDALYLLKYALFITVTQMLKNQKVYLTYIDEIALTSLIERTTLVLNKPIHTKTHEDLGFSVSMSFQAREESSYEALHALLQLAQ